MLHQRKLRTLAQAARLALGASLAWACSGQTRPGPPPQAPKAEKRPRGGPEMGAMQELGGIDEEAVENSFYEAEDQLQECIISGTERLSALSGDILLSLRLGAGGVPLDIWAEESSLGDQQTQQCMLQALADVTWPPPIGGKTARAKSSFSVDLPSGVEPPEVWDSARFEATWEQLKDPLNSCRASAAPPTDGIVATLYVSPEGAAVSAGVASKSPLGAGVEECLMRNLLAAEYPRPDPEGGLVKVRVRL